MAVRSLLLVLLLLLPARAWAMEVATVVEVVDGDTLVVRLVGQREDRKVRLIGVDTPETKHPEKGVEPYGPEASEFTKSLCRKGTKVRLEFDVQSHDKYGRILAYLFLPDGRMLNRVLLEEGLARVLTIPPNVAHADEFARLQAEAREKRKGMWGD